MFLAQKASGAESLPIVNELDQMRLSSAELLWESPRCFPIMMARIDLRSIFALREETIENSGIAE